MGFNNIIPSIIMILLVALFLFLICETTLSFVFYFTGFLLVITLINISGTAQKVTVTYGSLAGKYKLLTTGKVGSIAKSVTVKLAPWQYEVYSTN